MSLKNLLISILCVCVVCDSFSGAFEEGGKAYKSGNYELAAQKFMEVTDKNDHRAMYALGSMYASGKGVDQDYKKAFGLFRQAARYGRPDAHYKMGIMYEEGLGVGQNYKRALRMYQFGAKKGYGPAQYRLGMCYLKGLGVEHDPVKASAWLTVADANLQRKPVVAADSGADDDNDNELGAMNIADTGQIKTELKKILEGMSQEQQESARKLAREYMQYH